MLRHALALLAFLFACGPVAPAPTPDGAPPPALTSTTEATTSTGGHSSGAPTSSGSGTSGSTGAPDCTPLQCGEGCPAASKCLAVGGLEFCVEPTTGKLLCTSDGPCVDDNGTVTCV